MRMKGALEERKEDLEEPNNIIPFQTVTGGKGPPNAFWLKDLEIGTIFLAKQKPNTQGYQRTFVIPEFVIYNVSPKGNYLMGQPGGQPAWFDPMGFSNAFDLEEVLRTQAFQISEGLEEDDGSDQGPVRSGGLQDDAAPEGEHPVLPPQGPGNV